MQPSDLPYLRESDYVLLNVGVDQYVPLVVRRQQLAELVYDPVAQGTLAGPQVPPGGSPSASQSANYVAQLQLGLSAAVTSINGVFDIFQLLDDLEVYQVFFGIAPRQHRVWVQQPLGSFVTGLDQNIVPSASYEDVLQVDGFQSPYGSPSPLSEFFSLKGLSVSFALANPAPWPVNPRLDFYMNRLYVQPVGDPAIVQRLMKRSIPARYVSMGLPKTNMPWPASNYNKAQPLPSALGDASLAQIVAFLKKAGYIATSGGS
jgi:hypothetical protein